MFNSKNQHKLLLLLWPLFGLMALKSLSTRITDGDLWWHLAAGRAMVENRAFLRTDIFSHTMYGVPWINFEWLGQIIFYVFVKAGGWNALYGLKLVLAAVVILLMVAGLSKLGARGLEHLLAVMTSFFLLRPRLNERIELFSLVFLASFVFLLSVARYRPIEQTRKLPWVLFGLMVLWCNFHGGFIYGIGVVALLWIGAVWAKESQPHIVMTGKTLVLVILATLINPYGPRLFLAHWEHLSQLRAGLHIIDEWAPPSVGAAPFFWLVFGGISAALLAGLIKRRPEARYWAPAVVVFLVWAGLSNRNMALMVFPGIAFLVDMFSKWGPRPNPPYALLCIVIALSSQRPVLASPWPDEKVQWSRFPKGACDFVQEQNIQGVMYNSYEFGGYVEWRLGPERLVFMDGRYLFHPILMRHSDMNNRAYESLSSAEWQTYLREQNIEYAITNRGDFFTADNRLSSLDLQFPKTDWALVYWDDTACVFVRRSSALGALAREWEYKAVRPFNWNDMDLRLASNEITLADISAELARHKSRTGFTVTGAEMEKRYHVE